MLQSSFASKEWLKTIDEHRQVPLHLVRIKPP
jgi:hypothetical protein